jgi:hypothetical protein
MKHMVVALLAVVVLGLFTSQEARAFPGAMCFNASGCGRCEVCVKETATAPSGKCMVVAGCY